MQTSGTFPALNAGQTGRKSSAMRNPVTSSLGMPAVNRMPANPIAPPKKRRQLVIPQPKIATNPLGAMGQNGALGALVGNALNPKKRGF